MPCGKKRIYFEGVRVFVWNFGGFKKGAAMAVPRIGIFVGKNGISDLDLLRHEFGHILQYKKWGAIKFWFKVAFASVKSFRKEKKSGSFRHYNTWTEWSANRLAYNYFNKPNDWNFRDYPIMPKSFGKMSVPKFEKCPLLFVKNWIDC